MTPELFMRMYGMAKDWMGQGKQIPHMMNGETSRPPAQPQLPAVRTQGSEVMAPQVQPNKMVPGRGPGELTVAPKPDASVPPAPGSMSPLMRRLMIGGGVSLPLIAALSLFDDGGTASAPNGGMLGDVMDSNMVRDVANAGGGLRQKIASKPKAKKKQADPGIYQESAPKAAPTKQYATDGLERDEYRIQR